MGRSLYKSTLEFLIRCSNLPAQGIHIKRLCLLAYMIASCMRSKRCSLEGISRPEGADVRQGESMVKQAKRWLMSKWTDWDTFFAPYITPLLARLSDSGELVLAIDGSLTGQGCTTLMLSVIWGKHSIPIVWVTRKGGKGHFSDAEHVELVRRCLPLLPHQCRVVLLGDGEFDGQPLRDFCWANGWEFVLRTSLDRKVDFDGERARIDSLLPLIDHKTTVLFVEGGCGRDSALLWKAAGYEDPIPLLTNMEVGQMACRYYRRRFKIETMFKQMKSAGFHLDKSMMADPCRICNLLIVLSLAFILTLCTGLLIKRCDKAVISPIARADRVKRMGPITLAQKALDHVSDLAYYLFSMVSKNLELFFSPSG